jgi:hypothetical protein
VIQRENKIKERVVRGKGKSIVGRNSLIHINWFMGALTLFFFLKETTLIAPSPIFSEHGALPIRSTSFHPQSQN